MFEESKYYRPSGKFSPLGAVLITLCVTVLGVGVFFLYLLFNNWCPIIYLSILAAVAVAAVMGYAASKIIRLFKIRNKTVAVVCAVIGFLLASYVKWAMYDYLDLKKNYYNKLKDCTAEEFYDFDYYFGFEGVETQNMIDMYKSIHQSTTFMDSNGEIDYSGFDLTDEQIEEIESKTVWDYNNFEKLLGSDADEVEESLEKAKTMNVYEFTYEYRKAEDKKTVLSLLTSPKVLWKDIKEINRVGRWTLKSHSYTADKDATNVNGWMLWIVWAGEFVSMGLVFLAMTFIGFEKPFIESEDDWALPMGTAPRKFYAPDDLKGFKESMEMSEFNLFDLEIPVGQPQPAKFLTVECFKSRDLNENYLNVYFHQFDKNGKAVKKSQIIKFMRVSKEFILSDKLY